MRGKKVGVEEAGEVGRCEGRGGRQKGISPGFDRFTGFIFFLTSTIHLQSIQKRGMPRLWYMRQERGDRNRQKAI